VLELFGAWFESGRIIDLILLLVLAEAPLLLWLHRLGIGPGLRPVWPTLISGFLLMLALRLAMVDTWWGWIAAVLTLALLSHLLDLGLRRRG
jgi:hypothetical protein